MRRRPSPRAWLDRLAASTARRVLAWSAARLDGNERPWLDALAAELDEIEGGGAQLRWAMGGLRLVWHGGRRQMMSRAYQFSPAVLIVLGAMLFAWLAFSLAQQYAVLAVMWGVLTGIVMLVVVPLLIALARAGVKVVSWWLTRRQADLSRMRRVWSRLAVVAGALCLVSLLGLGLTLHAAVDQMLAQGPATAGVVASATDQRAVEGAFRQVPGMARPDVYLTTLVKPLAVNGMTLLPLEHGIIDKFASIQGFDLAHGQLPHLEGFENGAGATGPGPNQMLGPWGRQLDVADATTYNVMVAANCPHAACEGYRPVNGDLISVQSLVMGQTVQLRIVGQYWVEDGESTPLFGMVLADDSVVRLLSGGAPSSAYGLRVTPTQRQTLFSQLSAVAPAAQLYDFTSLGSGAQAAPGYTNFTDAGTEEGYFAWEHAQLTAEAAVSAALFASMLIVACWELRTLARARRRPSAAPST
jgi:hypothetical protein